MCACHSAGRRAVEGPRRCLSARAIRSFSTTAARLRICALCKISRTPGTVSLQPMAASACSNLKVTKTIWTQSLEKTAAHDHPEFKDLTKTRRRKIVTAHERTYARPLVRIAAGPVIWASVVEKLRTARADEHRRGSLGYVRDRLFDCAPPSTVARAQSV